MIDALIQGRIFDQPTQRTGQTGKPFTVAKLRTATKDDAFFVSVIAFDAKVQATLLALNEGDSVALAGELSVKVWTDKDGNARPGLDLVVHAVLTPYAVTRKRAAMQPRDYAKPSSVASSDGTSYCD